MNRGREAELESLRGIKVTRIRPTTNRFISMFWEDSQLDLCDALEFLTPRKEGSYLF